MTRILRVVLGDQLTRSVSSLTALTKLDVVLMMEVADEATSVPHHPKKIAYLFSAMRHFARSLRAEGITVRYVELDDPANTGSFTGEVQRAVTDLRPSAVVATLASERRVVTVMEGWADLLEVPVTLCQDDRFICSLEDFATWATKRRQWRMEHFYHDMRRRTGLLMTADGQPEGGQWNFDHDNRRPLPGQGTLARPIPTPWQVEPDAITRNVLDLVERQFGHHFGQLRPFWFPVTRNDALAALAHFIRHGLGGFGDYQDAMAAGQPFLYHSLLSLHLNSGLLGPLEVAQAAEQAWQTGTVSLNAAEGFIRQIIGWREYVRGVYWQAGPGYRGLNALMATRPLPGFYWDPDKTDMACVKAVVTQTRDEGYAHHIQRLMVTGNLALLMGIAPAEVNLWYLAVYVDAYEWVELPNTHGMALYADGGLMASKPYAASGKYIHRMSDYCKRCRYDPRKTTGVGACPFNALYWDFLDRNRARLKSNPRMALMLKSLDRIDAGELADIRREALAFIESAPAGY